MFFSSAFHFLRKEASCPKLYCVFSMKNNQMRLFRSVSKAFVVNHRSVLCWYSSQSNLFCLHDVNISMNILWKFNWTRIKKFKQKICLCAVFHVNHRSSPHWWSGYSTSLHFVLCCLISSRLFGDLANVFLAVHGMTQQPSTNVFVIKCSLLTFSPISNHVVEIWKGTFRPPDLGVMRQLESGNK